MVAMIFFQEYVAFAFFGDGDPGFRHSINSFLDGIMVQNHSFISHDN
jgi:hypothetical protein